MNYKYPTFNDWYNEPIEGLASVRSDFLMGDRTDWIEAWDAARETVDDPDLDQPATLEWVKKRKGWTYSELYNSVHITGDMGDVCDVETFNGELLLIMNDIEMPNPTRRQVIAAEEFAKAMGWV